MILAFLLIGLVWSWYQFGLWWSVVVALSFAFGLLRIKKPLSVVFVSCALIIFCQLEWNATHILPRELQHQTAELELCIAGRVKNYDDKLQSAIATVTSQESGLNLRAIKLWNNVKAEDQILKTGDCLVGDIRLKQPLGRIIPGTFHADRYYFSKNIDAIGSVKDIHRIVHSPNLTESLYLKRHVLFASEQGAQFWAALSFGWSSALDNDAKSLLIENQIMHLFVISGMHLGFIVLMLSGAMRLFCIAVSSVFQVPVLMRRLIVLSAAAAYVALLGFPLPASRALIMIAIPFLGMLLKERFSLIEVLGYTASVITLLWPEAWLGLGAWLSFWSVLIIVLLLRWQVFRRLNWFANVLLFETFLIIGSLPWAFLAGLKMNVFSILLNLVLTPLIAFVALPLALVIAVFPSAELISVWESMFNLMTQLLQITSHSSIQFKNVDWRFVIAALVFVCTLVWLRNRIVVFALIALCLTGQLLWFDRIDPQSLLMTVYDVGHGQAILIEKGELTMLYDTGGYFAPGVSLLESTLLRVLPQLDEIIVSHSDSDHAAGLQFILKAMPEARVWAGQPDQLISHNQVVDCHNRARISKDVFFVPVPEVLQQNDNDHSCVLYVRHQERSVVITGDSGKLVEYYLLQEHPDLFPADIVVLGHHGSDSSSSSDWLYQHKDALLIASSGDRASPKWPGKRVSRWFETHKTSLNTTAEQGSIQITIKQGDVSLKNFSSAFREGLIY